MTDRDLGALLQRAAADLPEVDFAEDAWAAALQERARRRRTVTGGVGALAAAALAVVAVQVTGGGPVPTPPRYTVTTPPTTGTLADRSPYTVLPLEGREGDLPLFEEGLPQVVDPGGSSVALSSLSSPPSSVVAVFLRREGGGYRPILVTATGDQLVADRLLLEPTRDRGGNEAAPLGPRAFGAGRYVVFPQPGAVVRLDVHDGSVTRYAVPSPFVDAAGWTSSTGQVLVRAGTRAWSLDPWKPGATAQPVASATPDGIALLEAGASARSVDVTAFDPGTGAEVGRRTVAAPVTELSGPTVSSARWSAVAAYLDQDLTSPLIRRGNGPIYQGLLAVQPGGGAATILAAPENPDGQTGRYKGCCSVLGWADDHTVLVQTVGSHGSWVLAWDVEARRVSRVTRIAVDPSKQEIPRLALNVGWRY
ncbi:hypothetical protein GCM10027517_30950 [Phycicoccus ginsengisoli]